MNTLRSTDIAPNRAVQCAIADNIIPPVPSTPHHKPRARSMKFNASHTPHHPSCILAAFCRTRWMKRLNWDKNVKPNEPFCPRGTNKARTRQHESKLDLMLVQKCITTHILCRLLLLLFNKQSTSPHTSLRTTPKLLESLSGEESL